MKFEDLKIGDSFTVEEDGGLFTKVSEKNFDNAAVVVRANVSSPVVEGNLTNFYAETVVLPVTEIAFTYQIIETKTIKKSLDN